MGRQERGIQGACLSREHPLLDVDPRDSQRGKAAAVHQRVGIADRGDDAAEAGGDDRRATRRRPPLVRARLEVDVERRIARERAGLGQRQALGMA